MNYFRKYSKFILILIFPFVSWLFINNTINKHYHVLKSGYIVYHAHPYQHEKNAESPFQSHHHSDHEFFILDLISNVLVILIIPAIIAFFQKLLKEIIISQQSILPYLDNCNQIRYRGPPL